jgi:hypothetical protein
MARRLENNEVDGRKWSWPNKNGMKKPDPDAEISRRIHSGNGYIRFEVFTALLTPFRLVDEYQCFGTICCSTCCRHD